MRPVWMFVAAAVAAAPLFAQSGAADASAMEAEIHRTGSVVLYGITFDAGASQLAAGIEGRARNRRVELKRLNDE